MDAAALPQEFLTDDLILACKFLDTREYQISAFNILVFGDSPNSLRQDLNLKILRG